MESPYFIIPISITFVITHHYILISEKNKLNIMEGDTSHDPFFSRNLLLFSSWLILVINLCFSWRIISLSLNIWNDDHILKKIINFMQLPVNPYILLCGIFLFLIGFTIRIYSIKTLGPFFTFEVGLRKNHQLIMTGPYRFIRHPGYLGYICLSLGMYLFLSTLLGLFLNLLVCFIIYRKRIPLEEKILANFFGEDFKSYKDKTKIFIPFIF